MASKSVALRVREHRAAKRKAGLRLFQMWVPDVRSSAFKKEYARQCRVIAEAEKKDIEVQHFLEATLMEIEGWTG